MFYSFGEFLFSFKFVKLFQFYIEKKVNLLKIQLNFNRKHLNSLKNCVFGVVFNCMKNRNQNVCFEFLFAFC